MNIELPKTNRSDDAKTIKKKVGYRRKVGKTIAMCIGIDSNLTEVTRILPTLKGGIIYILFYSLQRENEESLWAISKGDSSLVRSPQSLEVPLLPTS